MNKSKQNMDIKKHLSESITNVSGAYNEQVNEAKKGGKNSFSQKDIEYLLKGEAAFVESNNPKMVSDILFNGGGSTTNRTVYCGNSWEIHKYNGSMHITKLGNAMTRGKFIERYVIYQRLGRDSSLYVALANYCESIKKGLTLGDFIKLVIEPMIENSEELTIGENGQASEMMGDGSSTIVFDYKDDWTKGISVFSPFKVPSIKPLTKFPNKWKIADLIKVIANGQYGYMGRNYKYTDDYVYDTVYGGKIDYLNPIKIIQGMIENPEFYKSIWVSTPMKGTEGDDSKITIHFGMTNTSYTILVDMKKPMKPSDVIKNG